jgi:hypothetical protein
MCTFRHRVPVAIVWAPGVSTIRAGVEPTLMLNSKTAFEIVMCGITWWNALNLPRTSNAPLAAAIYRDGLLYFLVSLIFRRLQVPV